VADRKSPLRLARLHVSATSAFCSAEDPSEEAIWRSISLLADSVHPLRHSPPPPRLPLRTPPTTVPPALSPPSALAHRRTHVAARHDLLLPVLRHVHQLHNITVVGIVLRLGKLLCCRVGPLPPRPQLSFLSRTLVWSAYCHDGRSCCSPAACVRAHGVCGVCGVCSLCMWPVQDFGASERIGLSRKPGQNSYVF